MTNFTTTDEITAARLEIEQSIEGFKSPHAFAVGVATIGPSGSVLDVSYPHLNLARDSFVAAVLSKVLGHSGGTATYRLSPEQLDEALDLIAPAVSVPIPHPNNAAMTQLREVAKLSAAGGERQLVAAFIDELDDAPVDAIDGYLRLHLLSNRLVQPHGLNMDGIFGLLTNCVWTNHGPFEVDGFEMARMKAMAEGLHLEVRLVDKFPAMLDYVIPSGVRIADGNRVRLGAHLAEGTTVMHEGFCNFNAGTLGASMVEGRISAGVVVGDGSDVGGGASIMGTLSGGGTERISLGENCLLGANSGIGISLGDNCIVEAGLYITAGTRVLMPDGSVARARDISGASGLLFIRDSETGQVVAKERSGASWQGLNTELHKN